MSPATALGFALLGGALTLTHRARWARAYQALALLAVAIAWLGLTRYLFGGVPLLPFTQTAIHTALTLLLLASGVLVLRRDTGLSVLLANTGPAGVSARRLLPAALLVPLIAGVLALDAEHWGVLRVEQSFALFALSSVLVFAALVWVNATQVGRTDAERQRAQEGMQASEERARLIVETALDAVVTIDRAGTITGWSPQAESLFGWSAAEALGRSLSNTVIPERYREAHQGGLERYLATGEGPVLNRRIELSALRRDQSEFPVELAITPIRSGESVSFSAFVRDITERKRAEERLQVQAERLELLDRSTRAIAERQDLHSIFQVAIRSLEEHLPIDFGCVCLYEPTRQALEISCVGAKSRELALELALTEQARIGIDQNGLGRCVQGQLVYESDIAGSLFPFPARLARGGLRSLVIAPLSAENRVFGVMIVARRDADSFASTDCEFLRQLSEHLALAAHQAQLYSSLQRAYEDLRQTQESVMQQERLRALGQMASGIAHDINNALSPAALYVQSLLERDKSLGVEAREYLTVIQRAIDDVGHTVARMRMFYRPREPELTLAPIDLNVLLQQVMELTRARWSDMPQERGIVIDLKREITPDLPQVMGAENEIRDALTNLVFNAVDAMPDGGTLTVRSQLAPSGAGRRDVNSLRSVSVEVCDTGVGMTEAVRSRCLEPFFTTKGERGTGLGLAMVYGMVQRHSADFEIESAPGTGTTVRLIFPAAASQELRQPAAPVRALTPLRILLVDDDPLLLKSLRDVLESDGHSVTPADGGQAGITEFLAARQRSEPFAAVITDLGMPKVDGRIVAAAIKSAAPATPVILLTGWGQRLQGEGELPEHVDRVLGKPPRLSELRAALAELAGSTLPQ
jgi:PAS domain S-box-containing protein